MMKLFPIRNPVMALSAIFALFLTGCTPILESHRYEDITRQRMHIVIKPYGEDCVAMEVRQGIALVAILELNRLLAKLQPCDGYRIVIMNNTGGNVEGAVNMGKVFRNSNVHTVIKSNGNCYSGCGLAFLGGVKRTFEDGGSLYFHGAQYVHRRATCSPEMNNYIKAYILDLGYDDEVAENAVKYCRAGQWWKVSQAEAVKLGIKTP